MRHFPATLKILAACVTVAGLSGGIASAAADVIPQALVGTFTADIPVSLGQRCPNGELIGVRYIRTLTMLADGTADLNAVNVDAGQTDGCSRTGGTCNIIDTIEDSQATVEARDVMLIIKTGTGRETLKSQCNPSLNTTRNIRTRTVTTQWALVKSRKTGRPALRLTATPLGISCPNSFNKTGNDCPTVVFERQH